ncbi:MAG: hypothetical protein D6791_05500 [Chloroflexi bacterium]|nr:MAG: hypothetical protein D6791_05500 [Chloroflexota bacterium]
MVDILTIEPDEEVERIQARLARVQSRQVYLYVPRANRALRQRLALTLLRRTADDLGLNLTIVTRDSATRTVAGTVGLAVRWRLDGVEHGKWEAREGKDGTPSSLSSSILHSPASSVALAVGLLLLGLAVAILILPHATVMVTPLTAPLEMTVEIVADPDLTALDVSGRRVPARRLEVTLDRQAREPTSARTDIPDKPARGTVVFVNQSEAEVVIPAGSIVSTSGASAVAFRTQETATVPGPAGTTARVPVVAVEPGLAGNVPAYTVTVLDPGLGLPVAVVNDRPMSGGTVRRVGLVTQEERDRVRDALLERTRQEALQALQAQVREEETLVDESVELQVMDESFLEQAEAVADVITVNLTVRASGVAVNLEQARRLAEEALRQQVPAGQSLIVDSVRAETGSVLGVEAGLVRLQARAIGLTQAQIEERDIRYAVRGRRVDEAAILLRERFPLASVPIIHVSRGWLGRVPWLPMRIDVVIQDDSTLVGERRTNEANYGIGRG